MTEPSHAVFLSYASQDAQATQRICEALRAAGIEVWFDQSELRGGDVWDQKIRREIRDCALFIPIISATTASRHEGYFRLEWDLADQRTHMMARDRVFIVPVCLDASSKGGTDTPESFQRAQWTRLPNGETPPAFVERVRRLLSPEPSTKIREPASTQSGTVGIIRTPVQAAGSQRHGLLAAVGVVVLGAVACFAIDKLWISKPSLSSPTAAASPAPAAFTPPPHSIAVLPFVNMSGDKDQEYFTEGLTEELLNSLSRINELQVAARTSSFSFQGEHPDIATVAHKLNVGAVLEGSVRRSANTVRITTQLVNGITGFHLWSETYDRDLGDVLKLQTEIATAVASALKVSLLGDEAAKIELGGTRNPAAFDAYLRGMSAYRNYHDGNDLRLAVARYTDAIRLDPSYALAYAGRSQAGHLYIDEFGAANEAGADAGAVRADALKAITLAPGLAEGHLALAQFLDTFAQDFTQASSEYERAVTLAPGNAQVLAIYAMSSVRMGRAEPGIAAARRAVALDPLSALTRRTLARSLFSARHYDEAIAASDETSSLNPDDAWAAADRGLSYYLLGDLERARASCEIALQHFQVQVCRAIVYQRLGRRPEAQAEVAAMRIAIGDSAAYQYVQVYAQWGNAPKALGWLDTAARLRDTGLKNLKSDPLVDPLRNEPRFQAIERALRFPD